MYWKLGTIVAILTTIFIIINLFRKKGRKTISIIFEDTWYGNALEVIDDDFDNHTIILHVMTRTFLLILSILFLIVLFYIVKILFPIILIGFIIYLLLIIKKQKKR